MTIVLLRQGVIFSVLLHSDSVLLYHLAWRGWIRDYRRGFWFYLLLGIELGLLSLFHVDAYVLRLLTSLEVGGWLLGVEDSFFIVGAGFWGLDLKEAEEIILLDLVGAEASKDVINKLLPYCLVFELLYFRSNEKLVHFCLVDISWAISVAIVKDDWGLFGMGFDILDQGIEPSLHHFLLPLGLFQLLLILLLFHLLWANSLVRQPRQSNVVLLESGDWDAVLLLWELLEELHCVEGGTLRVESLDHL
jgi:hypothetical protein